MSSGPDPDPNKPTFLHKKNVNHIRKEKAKGSSIYSFFMSLSSIFYLPVEYQIFFPWSEIKVLVVANFVVSVRKNNADCVDGFFSL